MNISYFCVLTLLSLLAAPATAFAAETMKVIRVLKGDTVVAVTYKGVSKIIHLAGVDCPELNQDGGEAAKNEISRLILNKKVYVIPTVEAGTNMLASISPGLGGYGKDIGSEMLQNGFCWYRDQERDNLRSPLKASYKLLQDRARYKKKGIWKDGDVFFATSPDSWRELELHKLDQPRINGAPDPKFEGFNREKVSPGYRR